MIQPTTVAKPHPYRSRTRGVLSFLSNAPWNNVDNKKEYIFSIIYFICVDGNEGVVVPVFEVACVVCFFVVVVAAVLFLIVFV